MYPCWVESLEAAYHTGWPYDIVPEVLIIDSLREGGASIHNEFFDEAGNRLSLIHI